MTVSTCPRARIYALCPVDLSGQFIEEVSDFAGM